MEKALDCYKDVAVMLPYLMGRGLKYVYRCLAPARAGQLMLPWMYYCRVEGVERVPTECPLMVQRKYVHQRRKMSLSCQNYISKASHLPVALHTSNANGCSSQVQGWIVGMLEQMASNFDLQ